MRAYLFFAGKPYHSFIKQLVKLYRQIALCKENNDIADEKESESQCERTLILKTIIFMNYKKAAKA